MAGDVARDVARALGPHRAGFTRWHRLASVELPDLGPALWDGVVAVAHFGVLRGLPADPARWTPGQLAELLEALDAAGGADGPPLAPLTTALAVCVDFLGETGRWLGTAEDLAACRVLLRTAADPDGDLARLAARAPSAPPVDPAVEDAAVAALPLARDLAALLRQVDAEARGDAPARDDLALATGGAADDLAVAHLWTSARLAGLVGVAEPGSGQAAELTDDGRRAAGLEPPGDNGTSAPDALRRAVSTWLLVALTVPQVATRDDALADLLASPPAGAAADAPGPVLGAAAGAALARGLVLARGTDTAQPDAADGPDRVAAAADQLPPEHREDARAAVALLLARTTRAGVLEATGAVRAGLQALVAESLGLAAAFESSPARRRRVSS